MNNNGISLIDVLEYVRFTQLKALDLNHNNITNINVLAKTNFKKLKYLNLGHNKISDIEVFKNINSKELKLLNLKFNNIKDIKALLNNMNLKNLRKLYLTGNGIHFRSINDIREFEYKINRLKILKISYYFRKPSKIKKLYGYGENFMDYFNEEKEEDFINDHFIDE